MNQNEWFNNWLEYECDGDEEALAFLDDYWENDNQAAMIALEIISDEMAEDALAPRYVPFHNYAFTKRFKAALRELSEHLDETDAIWELHDAQL